MEKSITIEPDELEDDTNFSMSKILQKTSDLRDRRNKEMAKKREERALGLLRATEADMEDVKKIFLLIEEAKKAKL